METRINTKFTTKQLRCLSWFDEILYFRIDMISNHVSSINFQNLFASLQCSIFSLSLDDNGESIIFTARNRALKKHCKRSKAGRLPWVVIFFSQNVILSHDMDDTDNNQRWSDKFVPNYISPQLSISNRQLYDIRRRSQSIREWIKCVVCDTIISENQITKFIKFPHI